MSSRSPSGFLSDLPSPRSALAGRRPPVAGMAGFALLVLLGSTASAAAPATAARPPAAPAARAPSVSAGAAPSPAGNESPRAALEEANSRLKKVFGSQKPSWSPEADAKNADIKKIVGGFLDFEELAKRSLSRHWEGLPANKKAEFVKTLRELVERNYVRQLYGQPDYNLKLEKEEKTGPEATVTGTLFATARGKKVTMALEYKLLRKGNRWVVYDVVTDDLSLLENYRAEFNKVIAKESFDALLGKMKKKLAEKT
jgi:phospholipid transport system substrate-binding protein